MMLAICQLDLEKTVQKIIMLNDKIPHAFLIWVFLTP